MALKNNPTFTISPREWETLSAYLDQQLGSKENRRLEARLQMEIHLRLAIDDLGRTRQVLRQSPRLRVPHNFTLTSQQVKARQTSWTAPVLRFASVLSSLIFIVVLLGDLISLPARMSGSIAVSSYSQSAPIAAEPETLREATSLQQEQSNQPPAAADVSQPTQAAAAPEAGVAATGGSESSLKALPNPTTLDTSTPTPEPATATPDPTPTPTETPVNSSVIERFPWRLMEIFFGLAALTAGLAAYFVYRSSR
jgi:hypothetical protein